MAESFRFARLGPGDVAHFRALNAVFAEAFDDAASYGAAPPDDAYLAALLTGNNLIALAAFHGGRVVGGLVAYELDKFEQKRREIYIYDLAVMASHRRRGLSELLLGSETHKVLTHSEIPVLIYRPPGKSIALGL